MSTATTSFISKNLVELNHNFKHTAMVSHRGVPVSFAMDNSGKIFYSVLDLSSNQASQTPRQGEDQENDRHFWSAIDFNNPAISTLQFPKEIAQVGYGVVPNRLVGNYSDMSTTINDSDTVTVPDSFYSTTARLGAIAPFQALSDGKYIYIFRQSVAAGDANNITTKDDDPIVNSTLLVDRFILSGPVLKLSREVRYQRSRHKTQPASRKDVLSATDVEGKSFYEPTRELAFVRNLKFQARLISAIDAAATELTIDKEVEASVLENKFIKIGNEILEVTSVGTDKTTLTVERGRSSTAADSHNQNALVALESTGDSGNYSVLLIPGADTEEQRWQLFSHDAVTNKLNSFNIRFDDSIVFDTSDTQTLIDAFLQEYELDAELIAEVQTEIANNQTDEEIAQTLLKDSAYSSLPEDALTEIVYTIRTGVSKDDCIPASVSEWPLIEYKADGSSTIQDQYLDKNGVLQEAYQFQAAKNDQLLPQSTNYTIANGLSSCYYYQQEMDATNQPMKTKAAVMLAMGLEYIDSDGDTLKYIGILNFSVNGQGQLSRLTKDIVDLPDINMKALDENSYDTLEDLLDDEGKPVGWQQPQQMSLLDIDTNGLSTSGGVLKFAYIEAISAVDYSAAAEASFPYVFDDSLGRVNLYLKGKNDNFFVIYFSPNGSKSLEVTDTSTNNTASPVLSLQPRLDRDINIRVQATINIGSNTCTLSMLEGGKNIEVWSQLPRQLPQIASILNGQGKLSLGTLAPLGDEEDVKAGYLDRKGTVKIRTTIDNNLMFNASTAYANELAVGATHTVTDLSSLSAYLHHHTSLHIADKTFELQDQAIAVEAEVFYKSYLSGLVETSEDIDALWGYLKDSQANGGVDLIQEIPEADIINATSRTLICEGGDFKETDTTLSVDLVTNDGSLSSSATLDMDIAIDASSITVISMDNPDMIVGDYVQIDDEVVKVTDIVDNTLTVNRCQLGTNATTHSKGASIFPLALNVSQGDYIQIGSEILRVLAIYGNDLEVSRGQLSTIAADHSNGSTVTHTACLLNGTLNAVAQSLTLTSTAALGVVRGDTLKIDSEVLRVESVSGNRLSVTRKVKDNTGTATKAAAHANGAIVQLHQKGAPNSKAHLKEAVLIGTKATLINIESFDLDVRSLGLDLLQNTITISLDSTSGITENDHIKIDNEIFKVVAIDSENNEVTVYSAQQGTTASNHSKNAEVTRLDDAMQSTTTTFTLQQNLENANEADIANRIAALRQKLTDLLLEVAKVRVLEFAVQDTNTESVDRLEAGLQVEVAYSYSKEIPNDSDDSESKKYFDCNSQNLSDISTTSWEHPRSYLFNASITQNNTPTKTIINQNGFTATSHTTNLSAAIDKSVESITVASVGSITANCYLQIGDEVLEVTQINGSALTVKRGRMGSKAIAHVTTDSITLLHSLTVSSVSSLGIGINEYLQIDNEIFLVAAIQESAHQLLVIGAQLGTTATAHDNRATVTHYPCWVDADIDLTATALTVTSAQALGVAVGDYLQIEDEVLLVDAIDSDIQLTVTRQQKGSTAAAHARGTGMCIHSRGTLEIDDRYDYTYDAKNAIGQWEDWEASLAVEFTPSSATSGALLTTTTAEKLDRLNPSKQGLSAEAWIKPTAITGSTGATSTVLYHKNSNEHYSLGIQKVDATTYQCFATLGTTKYMVKDTDANLCSFNQWKHLAFTHQKYWGYQLASNQSINCGNGDGLHLNDEFSLEVLVKIEHAGTLLKKEGEYALAVEGTSVTFKDPSTNRVGGNNLSLTMGSFVKITLIRSKNKPQTAPSIAEYPMTGGDASDGGSGDASDKWYADKESDDIIKGMAEKQDQMEQQMDFAQFNMLGNTQDQQVESNPSYYHTLIITDQAGSSTEWQTAEKEEVTMPQAFQKFTLGGNGFVGTFDSVRIWNRALSAGDAELLDLPENKAGLIAHWRMEEGEGQYLYDPIGEHHGVATGSWVNSPRTDQLGQFQFYIDGAKIPRDGDNMEVDVKYSTPPSNDNQFSVGGYKTASSKGSLFKGSLEEIRVWNQARSHEEITDNAFGRLKGEWDQLLANYPFDRVLGADNTVWDASTTTANLRLVGTASKFKQVLSTAPVATEIPQIRSALTGVITPYHGTLQSRPQVVEYGDVQKNEDGTLNGILKRCYSFIDATGTWHRMTGYKVGNLVSQWYSQAQFAPQVMGYLEGNAPIPKENLPIGRIEDLDKYLYLMENTTTFTQAKETTYNYSRSKEAGLNMAVDSEMKAGAELKLCVSPLGFGYITELKGGVAGGSSWETSSTRSESYERGVAVNTQQVFGAELTGSDGGHESHGRYFLPDNTGYALVKSKTADIYLLRLAHNNALVSISWQPNPDIPEDVNIIPFPINPLYTKQGSLDGKFGNTTDSHYPQAQGAYGEYSYFKPREAYRLKKDIEREKAALQSYFDDFLSRHGINNPHFGAGNGWFGTMSLLTRVAQRTTLIPGVGPLIASGINQTLGLAVTQAAYASTELKEDLKKMGSQRNLVNTYVWTIEGGFYEESTEVAETQQETFASEASLSLGGSVGSAYQAGAGGFFEQTALFSSGSSFSLTKSKTKKSETSFGIDINIDLPRNPRYKYGGVDNRTLVNCATPGMVDAYRFMSFYLEPKGKNFTDLFTEVIDPIWLAQNPNPNAQALRQAAGNMGKAKPCWRILHRVTYVSRILPEFTAEAPPSLEKATRVAGFESNYGLIKRFEPYLKDKDSPEDFFNTIETIINTQLPEFKAYKQEVKEYLALYFNMDMN